MVGKYIEPPEKCFGVRNMCSHCSMLWRPGNYTVRVIKSKRPGKALQKLIESRNEHIPIPKCRASLIQKAIQNKSQKIRMKCSNCNKNTDIALKKSKRMKLIKPDQTPAPKSETKKKKKKKPKDKFCNLNISTNSVLNISTNSKLNASLLNNSQFDNSDVSNSTLKLNKITPVQKKSKKPKFKLTPMQTVSKFNKSKLENILNNSSSQNNKRSSLSSFLNELF